MKRGEINKLITAKLWDRGYGRGYRYHRVSINGRRVSSMAAVRKEAVEGDKITFTPRNGYPDSFVIKNDSQLIKDYNRFSIPNARPDKNKSRVYCWESQLNKVIPAEKRRLPDLQAAKRLVAEIYSDYGFDDFVPRVEFNKKLRQWRGWYKSFSNTIELHYNCGLEIRIVIHEAAHGITECLYGTCHWHDEVFVSVLVELYQLYLPVPDDFDWESWITSGERLGSRYDPDDKEN